MTNKTLNKSTADKVAKELEELRELIRPKDFLERFEDWVEKYPKLEDAYYYVWRKFKFSYWNPCTAFYNVKHGVMNLIKWFPVIWNDRGWDYHYWITMNIKKLEEMEKSIRNGHHLNGDHDADNIRKAILVLKRLDEDDYLGNALMFHDKKWGESNFRFEPTNDGTNCHEMHLDVEKATNDELKKQESKERSRCYRHSEYLKQQDLEFFNKIVTKYLFHWWD